MLEQLVKQEIEKHLDRIKPLFAEGMKLTFIARKPDNDRADFVVTNDDLAQLAKVVERMQARHGGKSEVAELRVQVDRLASDISIAMEALERYGDHDGDCHPEYDHSKCTCGYGEALAKNGGEEEAEG